MHCYDYSFKICFPDVLYGLHIVLCQYTFGTQSPYIVFDLHAVAFISFLHNDSCSSKSIIKKVIKEEKLTQNKLIWNAYYTDASVLP